MLLKSGRSATHAHTQEARERKKEGPVFVCLLGCGCDFRVEYFRLIAGEHISFIAVGKKKL